MTVEGPRVGPGGGCSVSGDVRSRPHSLSARSSGRRVLGSQTAGYSVPHGPGTHLPWVHEVGDAPREVPRAGSSVALPLHSRDGHGFQSQGWSRSARGCWAFTTARGGVPESEGVWAGAWQWVTLRWAPGQCARPGGCTPWSGSRARRTEAGHPTLAPALSDPAVRVVREKARW